MKFSIWPGTASPFEHIVEVTKHAEKTGWDGVWVADHFMPNGPDNTGPTGEAWTILAALAASVPRLRLGTLVTGNTYRHPAVLAKQAAQVDLISGGRLVFGLGAGWQENEHRAYGIEFSTVGGRSRRLEEAVQICKSLFTQEHTNFKGRYYTLENAPLSPKPAQDGGPPLLIGGGGEKVTMRIAAQYADEWNTWSNPELMSQKKTVLDAHCEKLGRDPSTIKRSTQAIVMLSDDEERIKQAQSRGGFMMIAGNAEQLQEKLQAYQDAGVDEFIVPNFNLGREAERQKDAYEKILEEVAKPFRD